MNIEIDISRNLLGQFGDALHSPINIEDKYEDIHATDLKGIFKAATMLRYPVNQGANSFDCSGCKY